MCALVTGVQTCALPICKVSDVRNALCNHRSGAFSGNRPRHPPLAHIDDTLILTNHRDRRLASRPNVRLRIVEDVSRLAISDEIRPGWDGFAMTFVMIAHTAEISSSRISQNMACIPSDLAFLYTLSPPC